MHFYKAFGLHIHSEIELPELFPDAESSDCDLLIRTGSFEMPALSKTRIARRGVLASFGSLDGSLILHWDRIATFKAENGKLLTVSPTAADTNLISLFTVSEALGLILFQRGMFLLHASCVKVGEEAWCFMGTPGAGKSTTAAAFVKAGAPLLSDDLTAITFDDQGVAYVVPAYPQLKIWEGTVQGLNYDPSSLNPVSEGVNKFSVQPKENFSPDPVRLGQVFFLHKSKNRKALQPLTAAEIPQELLKNFPLPMALLTGENLKRHFLQSFQCAQAASLWRMRRPDGFESLEKWVDERITGHLLPDHA